MTTARRIRLLRRLLVAVMVVICLGIGVIYLGYRHWRRAPTALVHAVAGQTDLSMDRVQHTATRDGRTEWVLDARQASVEGETRILRLEQLTLVFYPREGGAVQVNADRGRLDLNSNDIEVQDHVVVKNEHYRLDTQRLRYDHANGRIAIPTAVEIHSAGNRVSAATMTVQLDQRRAELVGEVKGTLSGPTLW